MPNQLTAAGLEVKTTREVTNDIVTALQAIYGADINVDQNSPDGQLINIFVQSVIDQLELLVDTYNSFAVPTAYGVLLDQRVALNGMVRRAGTYTFTDVAVTVDRALNLQGLDGDIDNPDGTGFTVADNAGNQFILATSHSFGGAGSATLSFRAKAIGQVETIPNTITNQITVVLGVTAVNNPNPAVSVGVNEESDAQLKIRQIQSFFLGALGPADSIEAALLVLPDVVDAYVVENVTNGTVDGVPAHSIWVITNGGAGSDIGHVIYNRKAPGCGMVGGNSFVITRPDGQTFTALWDSVIGQNLWIQFSIIPKHTGDTFDNDAIKASLAAGLFYKINQNANIGDVVSLMLQLYPNAILTDVGVSIDGSNYFDIVYPTTAQKNFNVAVGRISIV